MPIGQRRNRSGKATRSRYKRNKIRLQNDSCAPVDGDRSVEPTVGVRRDAAHGLTGDPQRDAAKTLRRARACDLIERVDDCLSRPDARLDGGSTCFYAFPPWQRKDERVIAVADEFGR